MFKTGHPSGPAMNEVPMNDDPANTQPVRPAGTDQAQSAATEVDQKNRHRDNDNTFSPGFKPDPDRPKSGEDTDADIDTDGG
ncbi:hypothetical protein B1219_10370 [Pseudomonas ogarae]|nr:hypothetical protein B1219_10370 [Pseudomonas ogarae]OPG79827.1 hypothetical protein B1218_08370 [Pseudomonas ogarae]QGA52985.1 hypothetical protein GFU70_10215 [Pseudomonas brassicacearum]QXH96979.1 hypothetical protein HU749_011470 [Pseudomonas zarinae]